MTTKKDRGFTLMELVLSITLLGVLLTTLYTSLIRLIEAKQALDDKHDSAEVATSIISRLTREIQLAYAHNNSILMPPRDNQDKRYPQKTVMIGESKLLENGKKGDSLTFLALEGGQYLPDGGTHAGLVQITYRVEKNPEDTSGKTFTLVREETPFIRPFERAYRNVMIFPITSSLTSLSFSFYSLDDDGWFPTWGDEKRLGLPSLVRFTVGVRSPQGKEEVYTTSVALHSKNNT